MATTLADAQYLNLATYRLDGTTVETPVWFAESKGAYYVFSAGKAGKVRRLRNSDRARIAPCDFRGRVLGEWIDVHATIVETAGEREHAYNALRRKYGWQMNLLDLASWLGGKIRQRAVIRIRPARHQRKQRRKRQ